VGYFLHLSAKNVTSRQVSQNETSLVFSSNIKAFQPEKTGLFGTAFALNNSRRRDMLILLFSLLQLVAFAETVELHTWQQIQHTKYDNTIEAQDVALYVPQDLPADMPDNRVGREVMDHTFRNFIKGKMTPNAEIFRTVKKVEETLNYDIAINQPSVKEEIQHKFRVQYRPFQKIAKLRYDGFFNANMEYFFDRSFMEYSVEKYLDDSTLLTIKQSPDPIADSTSALTTLNLSMTWY